MDSKYFINPYAFRNVLESKNCNFTYSYGKFGEL